MERQEGKTHSQVDVDQWGFGAGGDIVWVPFGGSAVGDDGFLCGTRAVFVCLCGTAGLTLLVDCTAFGGRGSLI